MTKVGREKHNRIKVHRGGSRAARTSSAAATSPIASGESVYFGYSSQLLVGGYVATVQQAKYAYAHHLATRPPKPKRGHSVKSTHRAKTTSKSSTGSTHHAVPHPIKVITTPPSLGSSTRRHSPPPDTLHLSGSVF